MRIVQIFASLALAVSAANAVSVPQVTALDTLENARVVRSAEILSPEHALEKRKGGGGKGGGGGGGGGGGRSNGGGSGGGSRGGSGPPRSYGGGKFYGGGATRPYRAGRSTPKGLVAGALIAPAAILLIMPGLWLYSVYPYHYNNPYRFRNMTRNGTESDNNNGNTKRQDQGVEETLPVTCLCQENSDCGCDENDEAEYLDSLVGNGSYAALNKTLVTVSDINGTRTLVINGTLPEGTTAPEDSGAVMRYNRYTGYWAMVMIVVSIVTYL